MSTLVSRGTTTELPDEFKELTDCYSEYPNIEDKAYRVDFLQHALRYRLQMAKERASKRGISLHDQLKSRNYVSQPREQEGQKRVEAHEMMKQYRLKSALTLDLLKSLNPGITPEDLNLLQSAFPQIFIDVVKHKDILDTYNKRAQDITSAILEMQLSFILKSTSMNPAKMDKTIRNTVERARCVSPTMRRLFSAHTLIWDFLEKQDKIFRYDAPLERVKLGSWEFRIEHGCFTAITGLKRFRIHKDFLLLIHDKLSENALKLMAAELSAGYTVGKDFPILCQNILLEFANLLVKEPFHGFDVLKAYEGLCYSHLLKDHDELHNTTYHDVILNELKENKVCYASAQKIDRLIAHRTANEYSELGGLAKFSHPFVDMEIGAEKMMKQNTTRIQPDKDFLVQMRNQCVKDYCTKYYATYRFWPPLTLGEHAHPGIKEAYERNLSLENRTILRHGEIPRESWGQVHLTPDERQPFETDVHILKKIKDTAIALRGPAGALAQGYWNLAGVSWEKKRLLAQLMLEKDLNEKCLVHTRAMAMGLGYDHKLLVEKSTPKERELKKYGRWFAQQTPEERFRRQTWEDNVKRIKMIMQKDSSTMISSHVQITKRIWAIQKAGTSSDTKTTLAFKVDASKWNLKFGRENCHLTDQDLLQPVTGMRGFMHMPIFEQGCRIYYNSTEEVITRDVEGETKQRRTRFVGPQHHVPKHVAETFGPNFTGAEGLHQQYWELVYIMIFITVLVGLGLEYLLLVRGDDLRVVVFVDKSLSTEDKKRLSREILNQFFAGMRKFGHVPNVEECFGSGSTLDFNKMIFILETKMTSFMKKVASISPNAENIIGTEDEKIANIVSASYSAAGVDAHPSSGIIAGFLQLASFMLRVRPGWTNKQIIDFMQWPSVLGGAPILHAFNYLVGGESDPLSTWIRYYQYVVTEFKEYSEGPIKICSQKLTKPSPRQLLKDISSLPVESRQRPLTYLNQKMATLISQYAKDSRIRALFKTATKKELDRIAKALFEAHPCYPHLLSNIMEVQVHTIAEAILEGLASTDTIQKLLRLLVGPKRMKAIMIQVMKVMDTLRRWRDKIITQPTLNPCWLDLTKSATQLVTELRTKAWGKELIGATYPPFHEAISEWGTAEDFYRKYPPGTPGCEYGLRNHLIITVSNEIKTTTEPGNFLLSSGPFEPFLGMVTAEGVQRSSFAQKSSSDLVRRLGDFITTLSYTWREDSNVIDAIALPTFESYGVPAETALALVRPIRRGTSTHRLATILRKKQILPNMCPNLLTQISGQTDAAQGFIGPGGRTTVNFLEWLVQEAILALYEHWYSNSRTVSGKFMFIVNPDTRIFRDVTDQPITFVPIPAADISVISAVALNHSEVETIRAIVAQANLSDVDVNLRRAYNQGELTRAEREAMAHAVLATKVVRSHMAFQKDMQLFTKLRDPRLSTPLATSKQIQAPETNMSTLSAIDPSIFMETIYSELQQFLDVRLIVDDEVQRVEDAIMALPTESLPLRSLMRALKHSHMLKPILAQARDQYDLKITPRIVDDPNALVRALLNSAHIGRKAIHKAPVLMITSDLDVAEFTERLGSTLYSSLQFMILSEGFETYNATLQFTFSHLPQLPTRENVPPFSQEMALYMFYCLNMIHPHTKTVASIIEMASTYAACVAGGRIAHKDLVVHDELQTYMIDDNEPFDLYWPDSIYELSAGPRLVLKAIGTTPKVWASLIRNMKQGTHPLFHRLVYEETTIRDFMKEVCQILVVGVLLGSPDEAEQLLRMAAQQQPRLAIPRDITDAPPPRITRVNDELTQIGLYMFPKPQDRQHSLVAPSIGILKPTVYPKSTEDLAQELRACNPGRAYRPVGASVTSASKVQHILSELGIEEVIYRDNLIYCFGEGHAGIAAYLASGSPKTFVEVITLPETDFDRNITETLLSEPIAWRVSNQVSNRMGNTVGYDLRERDTYEAWARLTSNEPSIVTLDADWRDRESATDLTYYQALAHTFLLFCAVAIDSGLCIMKVLLPRSDAEWIPFTKLVALFCLYGREVILCRLRSIHIRSREVMFVIIGKERVVWNSLSDSEKCLLDARHLGADLLRIVEDVFTRINREQDTWFNGALPVRYESQLVNLPPPTPVRREALSAATSLRIDTFYQGGRVLFTELQNEIQSLHTMLGRIIGDLNTPLPNKLRIYTLLVSLVSLERVVDSNEVFFSDFAASVRSHCKIILDREHPVTLEFGARMRFAPVPGDEDPHDLALRRSARKFSEYAFSMISLFLQ